MPFRTISTSFTASVMLMGVVGSAAAETSYAEFYRMNEDRQLQVMQDALAVHTDASGQENQAKMFCLTELFTNVMHIGGTDELPLGYRTAFEVLEFERTRRTQYNHDQSVEDVIDRVVELYCPLESE